MEYDLECVDIYKSFGDIEAVKNVSFNIPSGSFFSILGPSGCGKTTLMRMIAGFEEPLSGDILIKGKSVLDKPPNKRNVKMVFQHLALFPMMNVYDNIAYGLRCNGVSKSEIDSKVNNVLERIALPDVGKREIHQLSGGQKQRIAIARCLVLDPDLLLLDEPLGALDLKLREAMKIELKLLQHQFNTTFVYITHDQSEALVMSDYVAVMNNGRFEQLATPHQLYQKPNTAFVAGFVGDSNHWLGQVLEVNNEMLKVKTKAGLSMVCRNAGAESISINDAVKIFIRPEFIQTQRLEETNQPNNEHHNQLRGVIESVLFNGSNSRILVNSETSELVEADAVLTGGTDDFKPNEKVILTWAPEQAMCFSAQ